MALINLQDNLNWLLIRSSMVAKQQLMKVSEAHDLAPMQALALCILVPGETVAMSVISDTLLCDPSNVTGIVDRLSVRNFVERRECSTDRRVKTLSLTEDGIALRKKLLSKLTEDGAPILANLTEAETKQLKALLQKTVPAPAPAKQY